MFKSQLETNLLTIVIKQDFLRRQMDIHDPVMQKLLESGILEYEVSINVLFAFVCTTNIDGKLFVCLRCNSLKYLSRNMFKISNLHFIFYVHHVSCLAMHNNLARECFTCSHNIDISLCLVFP